MGLMVFGWWWWWWWFREKTWTWQWCYIHVKKPLEIARSFQRSKGYGVKPRKGAGIGSTLAWHGHHPVGTSRSMIYSDALDSTFEADMFSLLTAVQILVPLSQWSTVGNTVLEDGDLKLHLLCCYICKKMQEQNAT